MGKLVKNVHLIAENDLCISCGACKHACPYAQIRIVMNLAKGFYEPVVIDPDICSMCDNQPCLSVCPSYEEDFVQLANWTNPAHRIGPWVSVYTGYSTSYDTRARSSSGGIIKELCRHYLETNTVDAVITLRHFKGIEYEPDLYTSVEDVLNTPGSIYHNVNFERAIEIIKTTPGEFLIVATPCQLTSIRKWQLVFPEQSVGRIRITVGLVCGWMFSRHSLRHFCKAVGVDYAALTDVAYRGQDRVGALTLRTPGQERSFSRRPEYRTDRHKAPYKIAFSRTYNSKRCLLCVEHLNYLADIVVGDAWLEAFRHEELGTSIVIVRNSVMETTLKKIEALGRIVLDPATEEDVIKSQGEDLARGISAQRIVNRLKAQGLFAPDYRLPQPQNTPPSRSVWYRNYLKPLLFRYLTWRGFGNTWFTVRVMWYHISFWMLLPVRMVRKQLRFLTARGQ